jgi:hypothetical protein
MMKPNSPALRAWFDNCGGWSARHEFDALRRGIDAGLLNEQDDYGMTALHLAVSSGWLEGIGALLRAGADTELRYFRTGETALLTAASTLGSGGGDGSSGEGVVAALLAAGANPDAANHFGLTPRRSAQLRGVEAFAGMPEGAVQLPEPRVQNAEHLADHYHPRFQIPDRQERQAVQVGQAVVLYVYGPKKEGKQDTVKVRVTERSGSGSNLRYSAAVETPLERTHLAEGTAAVEFGPENIASVYILRPAAPE